MASTLSPVALGVVAIAYLLGSIPFSYLVARWRGVDVRQVGSGNVGATNVMRSAGTRAGAAAFVLDFLKGAAATWLAVAWSGAEGWIPAAAAVAAVLGHMFPIWLRFHGGKGVATGAGAFVPLAPWAVVLAMVAFAALVFVTRFVSVASMAASLGLAAVAAAFGEPASTWAAAAVAALLIVAKHHDNIGRLRRGQERRLGAKT